MSLSEAEKGELARIAARIRRDVIQMTLNAGSGHPGGCLSAVEILTVLFNKVLRIDPQNSGGRTGTGLFCRRDMPPQLSMEP